MTPRKPVERKVTSYEVAILSLRCSGGPNGRTMTLEEIGRHMWISRERVRQLLARALKKLRRQTNCPDLGT